MTIDEIKKEIMDNVGEFVTTEVKDAVIAWVRDTILPAAKEVAGPVKEKIRTQAATETGWAKFRDAIFIPGMIDAGLWTVGKIANKMVTEKATPVENTATQPPAVSVVQ